MKKNKVKYVVGGILLSLAAGAVVATGAVIVRNELVRITEQNTKKEITEYSKISNAYSSYEVFSEQPLYKEELLRKSI